MHNKYISIRKSDVIDAKQPGQKATEGAKPKVQKFPAKNPRLVLRSNLPSSALLLKDTTD
jgi:hypothetical protein